MNLDTSLFIENLVTGTASYLKEMGFDLSAEQEKTLDSSLTVSYTHLTLPTTPYV